ncbi:MAG: hypothetical protein ACI8RD_008594, partial [Bacillariaceae sp.]
AIAGELLRFKKKYICMNLIVLNVCTVCIY